MQGLLWLQVGDHGHRGPEAGRATAHLGGAAQERFPGPLHTGTDTPSAGWLAGGGGIYVKIASVILEGYFVNSLISFGFKPHLWVARDCGRLVPFYSFC